MCFSHNNLNTDSYFKDNISLSNIKNSKVTITNFPNSSNPIYNVTKAEQSFKITENGLIEYTPSSNIFSTTFVFKTFHTNEEMATIKFNKVTEKLVVTSKGNTYNGQPNKIAFKFQLIDSTNSIIKALGLILSDGNADKFKDDLNDENFNYGDSIKLEFLDPLKVNIINYPDIGDIFNFPNDFPTLFTITEEGITPLLTPNKIIVKSKDNEEVLSIQFAKQLKQFIVSSTGVIPNTSYNKPYLTLVLKDQYGNDILKSILNSNESGTSFKNSLNTKFFNFYNNSLTLIYEDKTKIQISNYPKIGSTYTPKINANTFLIHPKTLKDISFNNEIKIINDNNDEMAKLYFIQPFVSPSFVTIITTHTDNLSTTQLEITEKYVQYLQYSLLCSPFYTEILGKQDATLFSDSLNNKKINITLPSFLRLSSKFNNKILITNYKGENEYAIGIQPEFINITSNSLTSHALNYNKIILKNKDNSSILYLYFHVILANTIYINCYSTEVVNKDSEFFQFKILDENKRITKVEGKINRNETANVININSPFNISRNFNFEDILELTYSQGPLVQVFNYPDTSSFYTLTGEKQSFKITNTGLKLLNFLPNVFMLKSFSSDEEICLIEFDIDNLQLIVSSTGVSYDNTTSIINAFKFQLIRLDKVILQSVIKTNENANKFKNKLNKQTFQYDDLIHLTFAHDNKGFLTNYPNLKNNYNLNSLNAKGFKITENGIIPYTFPQEIKLNNTNSELILSIQFDILAKKFIFINTGNKTTNTETSNYFKMTLYGNDGITILKTSNIVGNDNGSNFINSFKNINFDIGCFIKLEYEENHKVIITNYPNSSTKIYIPPEKTISFEIDNDKLLPYTPSTLDEQEIDFIDVAKIKFNIVTKKLIVASTGNTPLPSLKNTSYYSFKLRNSSNDIKVHSLIKGDENGTIFTEDLNNMDFSFGDIIELDSFMGNKIIIKNFPTKDENMFINVAPFNLTTFKGFFNITEQGLKLYTPSSALPIPTLQNTIIINKINDNALFSIKFNTLDKVIQTFSFSGVNDPSSNYDYVIFKLYNSNNVLITTATLPSKDSFSTFSSNLQFKIFDYDYIVDLTYNIKAKSHIIITNLQGSDHIPIDTRERYIITPSGLIPIPINY